MAAFWSAVLAGFVAGLIIAAIVGGPGFFALLQISIEKGFLVGISFAMGVLLSDASYFVLAYIGLSQLGSSKFINNILGTFGGGFLIIFGTTMLLKKVRTREVEVPKVDRSSLIKSFFKGFLINTLNPSALLYWIVIVTSVISQYSGETKLVFAFFLASISTVFGTDVLKAFLAVRLKRLLTPKFVVWMNRISGSVIILTGIKLLSTAVITYIHKH
jgi:threonine/homoserine/homoserine lactone efflux protein